MSKSGYSGTPLPKKLGLKPDMVALFIALPDSLSHLAEEVPGAFEATDLASANASGLDYAHVFETSRTALEEHALPLKAMLKPAGMLWISWPKKASKVPTTITEDVLREVFMPTGLVDVKVCAVDEIWSGLKFMIRKDLR
jgi:hypothetical protein